MKRIKKEKLLIGLVTVSLGAFLGGCVANIPDEPDDNPFTGNFSMSEGIELKYYQATDSYSVVGIGTCKENKLRLSGAYNGKKVDKIEKDAFIDCSQIVSVEIDEGITSIGANAFLNCANLLQVSIGESVSRVNSYAFYNCYKLSEIYNASALPIHIGSREIGYVGNYAKKILEEKSDFSEIVVDENGFIFQNIDGRDYLSGYAGEDTSITLPTQYAGNDFRIADYCFYRSKLEKVTISSKFTELGVNSFLNCNRLKEIDYEGSLQEWGALTWENQDSNPLSNGTKLFVGGNAVEGSVTFDFDVQPYAFYNYSYLTDVTIGGRCTQIGASAFEKCSRIKTLTVENGLKEIADSAFQDCEELEQFILPNTLEKIAYEAFYGVKKLKEISFPSSLREIGAKAFYRNESVTKIYVPSTVKTIGTECFAYCMGLTDLQLSEGIETICSGAFAYCKLLPKVVIPDSVTELQENVFRTCDSLSFVSIGQGVQEILIRAFYQCPLLETIVLGSNVKKIADYSFVAIYPKELPVYCYYRGTQAEYQAIRNSDRHLKSGWDGSQFGKKNRTVYFYSESAPTQNASEFWHYVNGEPVAWA